MIFKRTLVCFDTKSGSLARYIQYSDEKRNYNVERTHAAELIPGAVAEWGPVIDAFRHNPPDDFALTKARTKALLPIPA